MPIDYEGERLAGCFHPASPGGQQDSVWPAAFTLQVQAGSRTAFGRLLSPCQSRRAAGQRLAGPGSRPHAALVACSGSCLLSSRCELLLSDRSRPVLKTCHMLPVPFESAATVNVRTRIWHVPYVARAIRKRRNC